MSRNKNILLGAVAALMMIPSLLMAQSYGSINTFSPYTMFGIGDLKTQGTITTRSMAGMGVSLRSMTEVNVLNPASYSAALNKSVLFSYGLDGANYFNTQKQGDNKVKNAYATFNFNDIALQIPIARNLGIGISLAPYSSVGYDIATSNNYTNIGLISYTYEGGGDITQVKLGAGWRPIKNLSFGVAAQYYWGNIYRSFTMTPLVVTGNGTYYSAAGETNYDISRIKAQLGLQWTILSSNTQNLAFGATYDFGGDLKPKCKHGVFAYGTLLSYEADTEAEPLSFILPQQFTAGLSYQTPQLILGFDYTYQNWASQNSGEVENTLSGVAVAYNNFSTYKLGVQWVPNRNDARHYFRRVAYRGGLRYGGYQQTFGGEKINQYAATVGLSFPVKTTGISKIDCGFEYGKLGSSDIVVDADSRIGLVGQQYIKFSLGFTLFGEDYWFQRPKFD